MSDFRATQIGQYLRSGVASSDAIKVLAYLIQQAESRGDLEIFITDEIDKHSLERVKTSALTPDEDS